MTRRYVCDQFEPGEDDRGARDEGYYYEWCDACDTETEHESDICLSCGEDEQATAYSVRGRYKPPYHALGNMAFYRGWT